MSAPPASPPPSASELLGEALAVGLAGGLVIALVEVIALGGAFRPSLLWAVAGTVGVVGLLIAAALAAADLGAARFGLGAWGTAFVRASSAALVLVPVGLHLFDGGYASTLPIAASAALWLPLVGWMLLAVLLRAAAALPLDRPRHRRGYALALGVLVVTTELANRRLYPTQYRELHGALAVASCVGAGLAVRLLFARTLDWSGRRGARRLGWLAAGAAVVAVSALTVARGTLDRQVRWTIATRGMHARLSLGALHEAVAGWSHAAALPGGPRPSTGRVALAVAGDPQLNVIVLLVDTLRADALRPGPDRQRDFPNLSAFFDGAHSFPRAFAPSAGTDVSVATLITGHSNPFRPGGTTMAEAMRASGRATHGVFPTEMLRWAGNELVTRGFDRYDRIVADGGEQDVSHHGSGARTTDLGVAFLDRLAARGGERPPFFLWLHYFDVHEHSDLDSDDPGLVAAAIRLNVAADGPTAERRLRRDPRLKYRVSVALVDQELGRLEAALRQRGLWDRTAILLVSDHGESLGEDERLPPHHGGLLYEPLIRVPLAIRLPGSEPGRHLETVTLVDLMPTLLQLTAAAPIQELDGRSLVPLLRAAPLATDPPEPRLVVLHEERQHGVIRWPHKLLLRPEEDLVELYDLSVDPEERVDLSVRSPALVEELAAQYRSMPALKVDRTRRGRLLREQLTRGPASP